MQKRRQRRRCSFAATQKPLRLTRFFSVVSSPRFGSSVFSRILSVPSKSYPVVYAAVPQLLDHRPRYRVARRSDLSWNRWGRLPIGAAASASFRLSSGNVGRVPCRTATRNEGMPHADVNCAGVERINFWDDYYAPPESVGAHRASSPARGTCIA